MQANKTCPLVEQYLAYLVTIKGRSKNTVFEYRLDLLQFFRFLAVSRNIEYFDFRFINIELFGQYNSAICMHFWPIVKKS